MLDWEKIETVLLDMDGTLLDLNFDNHFWQEFVPLRYARQHHLTLEESKRRLEPLFKSMEGKLEWYCLDYWSRELQLDIAGLKAEVSGLIAVLPHVTDFLEQLKASPRHVLLVTNAHPDTLGIKMEKTCLRPFFDAIVCSHDYGMPKEHSDFWPQLQSRYPFDKHRTVLIDDSLAVLNSARQFGIAHLVAVARPDSRRPPRQIDGFIAVQDFRVLMPGILGDGDAGGSAGKKTDAAFR
ncbi:MAG: GMP/IMP nucleotidase [Gammaproteobacteria bacterium]